MQAAEKAKTRALIVAILMTICLVGGIPVLIVGAAKHIGALLGIGIACAVIGFYGTPMGWVIYGTACTRRRMVMAITQEHLSTVEELSSQLALNDNQVRGMLDVCFSKGFLIGYKRDGDNILFNDNVALGKQTFHVQCPNCGAKFSYTKDNPNCPYCGCPVIDDKD